MRKLLLAFLCLVSINSISQVTFTSKEKVVLEWNQYLGKYENPKNFTASNLFILNKEETMLSQTGDATITWFILDLTNKTDDIFSYNIVSDSMLEGVVIFDFKNQELKFLLEYDSELILVCYPFFKIK